MLLQRASHTVARTTAHIVQSGKICGADPVHSRPSHPRRPSQSPEQTSGLNSKQSDDKRPHEVNCTAHPGRSRSGYCRSGAYVPSTSCRSRRWAAWLAFIPSGGTDSDDGLQIEVRLVSRGPSTKSHRSQNVGDQGKQKLQGVGRGGELDALLQSQGTVEVPRGRLASPSLSPAALRPAEWPGAAAWAGAAAPLCARQMPKGHVHALLFCCDDGLPLSALAFSILSFLLIPSPLFILVPPKNC